METFHDEWFKANVCDRAFVQEGHSKSGRGVLRGLHYRVENTQGKLIHIVVGEVFDITVDMYKNLPTFGRWAGEILSAENKHQPWVSGGFTYDFYVLSDEVEFAYKCTDYYNPGAGHSLIWSDPSVNINWPLQGEPSLSSKNLAGKVLAEVVTL